jgi:uridine kinase
MSPGGSADRGPGAAGQAIGAADRGPRADTGQAVGADTSRATAAAVGHATAAAVGHATAAADGQAVGAVDLVLEAAARWRAAGGSGPGVIVIAIDGHGGAGKSTIAEAVAKATGAALVHTDDFFQAPTPCPGPRAAQAVRLVLADYYDWRRLRAQALEPLRAGRGAAFRRFDWERGSGLDGTVTVEPSDLILVEGVYSAAPELGDLVDRSVFVDTPEQERLRRLRGRVMPEEWDDKWLLAEHAYFDVIRPPSAFDLVVSGAD